MRSATPSTMRCALTAKSLASSRTSPSPKPVSAWARSGSSSSASKAPRRCAFALALDQRDEQMLLVLEIDIERALRDARRGGDVAHAGGVEAARREHRSCAPSRIWRRLSGSAPATRRLRDVPSCRWLRCLAHCAGTPSSSLRCKKNRTSRFDLHLICACRRARFKLNRTRWFELIIAGPAMSAETVSDKRRDRLKLVDPAPPGLPKTPSCPRRASARTRPTRPRRPGRTARRGAARPGRRLAKRAGLMLLATAAIGVGGWYGLDWWHTGRFIVSTDDAYVGAEMATISAKLSANIADDLGGPEPGGQGRPAAASRSTTATGASRWRAPAPRAPRPRRRSRASTARSRPAGASLEQAQAQAVSAQAGVTRTLADFDRANSLAAKSYGSQATLDAATAQRDQAKASLGSARGRRLGRHGQYRGAEGAARRGGAPGRRAQGRRAEGRARPDLHQGRSSDRRPRRQHQCPARRSRQRRQAADVDRPARQGLYRCELQGDAARSAEDRRQRDRITVDALPGQVFEGTVSGISGGTGSVFTLLPPDNATGNFTKIVQRVPVRIALAPDSAARARAAAGHVGRRQDRSETCRAAPGTLDMSQPSS